MTMTDDYRVVNFQGQVIRDTAKEREVREELRSRREGEVFTASTDCPDCGHLAVHWLAEPNLEPQGDDPVDRAWRSIVRTNQMYWGSRGFDPPGTVVARVCVKCNYRWGQT